MHGRVSCDSPWFLPCAYRLYKLDQNGHVYSPSQIITCEDDDAALIEARTKGQLRRPYSSHGINAGGTGMGDVLHASTLEQVVATGQSVTTDDEVNAAPIELSTIMIAEPGTTKGEDIYNAIQAAKAENVTITSKLRGLQGAKITTVVSAGPGVVAQAVRSGGRKRKRGNRAVVQEAREWRERLKRQGPADEASQG